MQLYSMDSFFKKLSIIEGFSSLIWTERYYGDGEVTLVVPNTKDMVNILNPGTFLYLDGTDEIMILETENNDDDGNLKFEGVSLLKWFNNRFVRASNKHEDRYWNLNEFSAGYTLWYILYSMCHEDSDYLTGVIDTGIPDPEKLAIPELGLLEADTSGDIITVAVPYGPVYNGMKEIATTYEIGMQLVLVDARHLPKHQHPLGFTLGFRSYKGVDRSSSQENHPIVRFSKNMNTLTNLKELKSIAALKTNVYSFAPGLKPEVEGDPELATTPGISPLPGFPPSKGGDRRYTGFNLRALMTFEDDITTDQVGGDPAEVIKLLNSRANNAYKQNRFIYAIDGEIIPKVQFRYGIDYILGDIIEIEGNDQIVRPARVTEYIRTQDTTGENSYPTIDMLE